jgi:8-oxo-dGTP diphosphatase
LVRVRVAALTIRDDRILLARHIKNHRTSYLLPGGGLEIGETAHEALVRELREEAGVECSIGALRYVVEARAANGSRHIVQLTFDVRIEGEVGESRDPRVAGCEWHPISGLRTLPIHPAVGNAIADDLGSDHDRPCRYLIAEWVD